VTGAVRWREVPLVQIDLDASVLELAAASDLDRLRGSLSEVGLLNPPWLRPGPGGQRYSVVTGARRLALAADLGWQEITARLLPESTSDFHCLLVHLFDNAFTRGFNLWEQATLAARLSEHVGQAAVATKYLPYLGLPPSPAHLARLLKLAALSPPWPRLAAQGRLALTAAATLADWDRADRDAAWPFFDGLRLSQSKQEEFLEQVALLARREGLTPAGILADAQLHRALTAPDRTPQERTVAVRRHLYRWFYPRLSAAQEAFANAVKKLGLARTPRLRLQPPAAFEGPDFHLEIKFRDTPELQKLLAEITRLAQEPDFADLTGN
jgi:ParB family transcriptional regulator, chromosome partitioning protein